jgi:type III secretion protein C
MKHIAKTVFLLVAICSVSQPAPAVEISHSTSIPFSDSHYYHFSKDQKLSDLIQDFCSMQSISVVISPGITDVVNGRFNRMTPSDFWNYVTRAYGLAWFYDGKILYAYKSSELQTQVFKMDANGIIILSEIIQNLGFSSSDFSFRSVPDASILVVTAPPKYLETINDLAEKFVTEKISDTTVVKSFALKHAWAYDMSFNYRDGSLTVPGVSTLLKNIISGESEATSVSGMSVDFGKNSQHGTQKMQSLVMRTKNDTYGQGSDGKAEQKSDGGEKISTSSTLPGFVTCDQRLNAIIIRDRYENMAFYEDIIRQLDVPCEVIKIDVAIVDVNRSNGLDLGLTFAGLDTRKNQIAVDTKGEGTPNSASQSSSQTGNWLFKLHGKGTIFGKYCINSYVEALEKHGNARTIAKPSVLTLDNVGAIIEKDSTTHVKVSGYQSEGLYEVTATTKLQVVPHIIPGEVDEQGNHKMKVFVNIQDGALSGTDQSNATPSVDSSSINTQAVLYEGQSLLVGGYFKEMHTKKDVGIPFIQNLPLVGNLFKHTSNNVDVMERIYLISPSIVDINKSEQEWDRFMNQRYLSGQNMFSNEDFLPKPRKQRLRNVLRGAAN